MIVSSKKYPPVQLEKVVKKFIVIFLPSILLVVLLSMLINFYFFHLQKNAISKDQKRLVDLVASNLTTELESAISDLIILSSQYQIIEYNSSKSLKDLYQVERTFLKYCIQKRMYDQIRLIDENGMEKVRIDFNKGKPLVVPRTELQNKKHRYYFKESIQLNNNQIFVSPFDLNIEHQKIEFPLKPVIRFGTPVFDKEGKKKGIVVINYFGQRILDRIKRQEVSSDSKLLLINKEGFWLKGINPSMEWGFMYKDRQNKTFATAFPKSYLKLSENETGQFENSEGLFSFCTIHPIPEKEFYKARETKHFKRPENWRLVSWISKDALIKTGNNLQRSLIIMNSILFLLLGVISWLFAVSIIRRKMAEQEVRQKKKFEGVVEMAGAASHELNQPLQAAKTYTQILLAEMTEDTPSYSRLQKLNRQIDKLGKITARLMHITSYKTKNYAGGNKIIDIELASRQGDSFPRL